jgi:hypothetical protein
MGGSVATYYDILRVGRQAAPDGVRAAYRKLAQTYHPDKLPGNADAVRVMAMLNEAYAVLSDPQQRASYDQHIEKAQAHARRARRLRMAAVDAPIPTWPWYLLFTTIALALAAVCTVLYKARVPSVAVVMAAPAVQAAVPAKATKN